MMAKDTSGIRYTRLPGSTMKVIEASPVIWGYKRGYSVQDISEGLQISISAVNREIEEYRDQVIKNNRVLHTSINIKRDDSDAARLRVWQKQKLGARKALAAIEAEKAMKRIEAEGF